MALTFLWADKTAAASAWFWATPVVLVVIVLPHIALHIRYLRLSRGQGVTFDKVGGTITFHTPDGKVTFANEDIQDVQITLPRTLTKQTPVWFPWQEYCYAVVVLKTGERFLITCLTVPGLRWSYEFSKVEVNESLFCWPPNVQRNGGT